MDGHTIKNDYTSKLPFEYISEEDLPSSFNWGNINGTSYLTHMLNVSFRIVFFIQCSAFFIADIQFFLPENSNIFRNIVGVAGPTGPCPPLLTASKLLVVEKAAMISIYQFNIFWIVERM